MPSDRLDDLRADTRYARERYRLYKARTFGRSQTSTQRLAELRRAFEQAQARLRFAEAEQRHAHGPRERQQDPS
jgi:hypothetical protein